MRSLYEPQVGLISKVLDLQLQRQNVIMSNLANVDTPRYRTRNFEFEEELQKQLGLDQKGRMSRTNALHMPSAFNPDAFSGDLEKSIKPRVAFGEDRVNMDKEMTKMAKVNLNYNALSQVIKSNFEGIKNIIAESSRS